MFNFTATPSQFTDEEEKIQLIFLGDHLAFGLIKVTTIPSPM